MRIGIDIRTSQLGSGVRGIGKYIYELIEGLVALAPDNEYILFAFPNLPVPTRLTSLPDCCRIVSVPTRYMGEYVWREPIPRVWRVRYQRYRQEHARGLGKAVSREKVDVIHLPCVIDPKFFADGNFECRVVKTSLDAIPLVFSEQLIDVWPEASKYVYRLQLQSLNRADVVVAISECARQDTIRFTNVPPDKIHVIYCSIAQEFVPISNTLRLKTCEDKFGIHEPYFLFCSGVGYNKNRERTIEAFGDFVKQHKDPYQFVFVSPDNNNSEAIKLKTLAFDLGLNKEQFLLTGFVSDDDLVTLFSGAQALVTPSLYEGFGLPAAQAMQAGTPVIASDRSSHPEVVGDAGLLVDPYSVEAITEAMLRIAREPDLRADLSARGIERAKRFHWKNQAQAMLDIYMGKT